MSATVELIVDGRDAVGESPVWREAEQALYWTDIPARKLHRWSVATGVVSTWATPQMVGCIAPMALTGQWVAAMEDDVYALTLHDDGRLDSVCLAGVDHAQPGMRFNDGRCDRQGRFWAGTMVHGHGACSPSGRVLPLQRRRGAGLCGAGFDHAQRHGLQPRWPHHVPVGLSPHGANHLGF
jgi:sugar lactone lactonase YvrE